MTDKELVEKVSKVIRLDEGLLLRISRGHWEEIVPIIKQSLLEERLDRPELREGLLRVIARIWGEDYDSFDEETMDAALYWVYEIEALLPDEKEIRRAEREEIKMELEKTLYKNTLTNIWDGSDIPILAIRPEKWQSFWKARRAMK